MESPERGEQNPLEELNKLINDFPTETEKEFSTTENQWWKCFGSCAAVVGVHLAVIRKQLSAEQYQRGCDYLEKLWEVVADLRGRYPTKADVPPEEEKQTLFAKFEVFRSI